MATNEITPAAEALNTAQRDAEVTSAGILRKIRSIRGTLDHVERGIESNYHLSPGTGIPEIDVLIATRQAQIETLKLLRFALEIKEG